MSFSKEDRNVQARSGKGFPVDPLAETEARLANVIAEALRRDFGGSPAHAKRIAHLIGVSPRTVKNWLQAENSPNGAGLIVLMRHSDGVTAAVLELAQRHEEKREVRTDSMRRELRGLLTALLEHLGPA